MDTIQQTVRYLFSIDEIDQQQAGESATKVGGSDGLRFAEVSGDPQNRKGKRPANDANPQQRFAPFCSEQYREATDDMMQDPSGQQCGGGKPVGEPVNIGQANIGKPP
jgi:hypothetical protein